MAVMERDVIIVGAGPAGSICASYLAKAGVDVLLLEKDILPRDKTCGDMQCEGVVSHLGRLGVIDALDAMSTCIRHIKLISGGNETLLPFECYCAPRYELDKLLADTAVKYGAELRQGCRVTDVLTEQGFVTGVKIRYRGEEAELRSKLVIGADGAYSVVAKALGIMEEGSYGMWLGERAYFKGIKLDRALAKGQYDAYGVFAFDDSLKPGYFWIMPVGRNGVKSGMCNVGMLLQNRDAYKGADLQERFFKWINGSAKISVMFENAERISPWSGGRINDITQGIRKAGNGFMLIGDAAAFVIPLSNDGLSHAADSAKAAADAAMAALAEKDLSEGKLMSEYKKALGIKSEEELTEDLKETRLLMESMHDISTMDRIIQKLEHDPVYRKRHMK